MGDDLSNAVDETALPGNSPHVRSRLCCRIAFNIGEGCAATRYVRVVGSRVGAYAWRAVSLRCDHGRLSNRSQDCQVSVEEPFPWRSCRMRAISPPSRVDPGAPAPRRSDWWHSRTRSSALKLLRPVGKSARYPFGETADVWARGDEARGAADKVLKIRLVVAFSPRMVP